MSESSVTVGVASLANHDPRLALPRYETAGAAGMDLRACLAEADREAGLILPPMGRALVPTGLALILPGGHEGQVRPRSGLAARHGITVLNAPGTIDSDYRGEVQVLLINLGPENYRICHGDRIAQLVVAPCCQVELQVTETIDATARGAGGFGSTGGG